MPTGDPGTFGGSGNILKLDCTHGCTGWEIYKILTYTLTVGKPHES